jgi:N,N'-diacetylchitobiose transport system permease protein
VSSTTVTSEVEDVAAAAEPRQPRRPRSPRRGLSRFTILWLLLPAGVVLATLTISPIVFLLVTSFTDYGQRSLFTGEFAGVGFDQYVKIFTDPDFWWAAVRTAGFTIAMVGGSLAVGMSVAHLLTRVRTAIRYALLVALVLAWAMPTVASSQVWNWMFQPGYGVINWLLSRLGIFGDMTNVNWSQSPGLAFLEIWLLVVWQAVPFIALTVYAAESQMPVDHLEAARLDGAGEWRIYWTLTANFLRPTLLLVATLSIIWDFNIFNEIWLVSEGGPDNSTSTLGIWMYKVAFIGFHIGEGAAISVVTTLILMIVTAFYIRRLLRAGEDL